MANSNKHQGKGNFKNRSKQQLPINKKEVKPLSLLDGVNNWFDTRARGIAIIIFACGALFSILLFQARMDIGGDDSAYLQRAYDFIHKGIFPSFQGPLYPIVLSFFIGPFGINIILLKVLSVLFNFIGLYFFYRTFKDRVPAIVFYPVFFICATNTYILNYASLTYSEAFYSCIQYIFFYYFFKLIDKENYAELSLVKENYRYWLLPGLFLFALVLTRNVGISSVGAIVAFFVIEKQYRNIVYVAGVLILYEIPATIIEKTFFKAQNQWGSQGNTYLYKDPYDFSKGKETLSGFFTRFFQNCDIYVSKRLFEILGFRSEASIPTYKPFVSDGLMMFVLMLFVIAAFILYRLIKSKNRYMLLAFLYVACIMGTSFIALQTRWDQPRIIMICVPLLLMTVFYAFYDLVKKGSWAMQLILFLVILVFTFAGSGNLLTKTNKNLPVLSKNLHGDIYYGYTPDWVNYLRMSRWCADSLPKDAYVAARKAPMSFIYGNGKEFFPVYKVYSTNADSLLSYYKLNKVNYVMVPSLRMNPEKNTGDVITTMEYMIAPIYRKYPQKVKFIHREGTDEVTDLFQIIN